jgi:hypothetical protein
MRRRVRRVVATGIALTLFAILVVLGCTRKSDPMPDGRANTTTDVEPLASDRIRVIDADYHVDTGTTWLWRKRQTTLQFRNNASGPALVWFVDAPAGEVIPPNRHSKQYVVADSAELRTYPYRIHRKVENRWEVVPHTGPTEPQVVAGD